MHLGCLRCDVAFPVEEGYNEKRSTWHAKCWTAWVATACLDLFYDSSKKNLVIFPSTFFRGSVDTNSRPPQATCWTQVKTLFSGFIRMAMVTTTWIQTRIGALGRYRYPDFLLNESTPISTYSHAITTSTIERTLSGSLLMSRPFWNINKWSAVQKFPAYHSM